MQDGAWARERLSEANMPLTAVTCPPTCLPPCCRPCRADQARPRRQQGSFPAKMGIAPRELQAVQSGQAL
jgi:hypothetical protein